MSGCPAGLQQPLSASVSSSGVVALVVMPPILPNALTFVDVSVILKRIDVCQYEEDVVEQPVAVISASPKQVPLDLHFQDY
ncbi:hypothetical protein GCM10009583_00820 [Ornithinicoccus hortensis]